MSTLFLLEKYDCNKGPLDSGPGRNLAVFVLRLDGPETSTRGRPLQSVGPLSLQSCFSFARRSVAACRKTGKSHCVFPVVTKTRSFLKVRCSSCVGDPTRIEAASVEGPRGCARGFEGGAHLCPRSGGGVSRFRRGVRGGVGHLCPRTRDGQTAVCARSVFRLRGSLVPRNGRAIYLRAIGKDAETSPGRRGWDRSPTWRQRRERKGCSAAGDLQVGDDGTHPVARLRRL